jgi:hypothetical protein
MKPGQNQWIGITFPASVKLGDEIAEINFTEVVNNISVNGFTIAVKSGTDKEALLENYRLHAEVFFRIGNLFGINDGLEESKRTIAELIKAEANPSDYLAFIEKHKDIISRLTELVLGKNNGEDPFQVKKALAELISSFSTRNALKIMLTHSAYNHKMDAFLTFLDKENGDVADILQNIYWQLELYKNVKLLSNIDGTKALIEGCEKFYSSFNANKATLKDYNELIRSQMGVYKKTADLLMRNRIDLEKELSTMNNSISNTQLLQKAHYNFLMKLNTLR